MFSVREVRGSIQPITDNIFITSKVGAAKVEIFHLARTAYSWKLLYFEGWSVESSQHHSRLGSSKEFEAWLSRGNEIALVIFMGWKQMDQRFWFANYAQLFAYKTVDIMDVAEENILVRHHLFSFFPVFLNQRYSFWDFFSFGKVHFKDVLGWFEDVLGKNGGDGSEATNILVYWLVETFNVFFFYFL